MSGKLSVHCIAGRNLYDAGDLIGSQDPYLKLTLGSTKLKSSVHKNGGTQAQWADKLTFPVPADPALAPTTLHVACWDKDTISSDDLIGTADVNLPQVLAATGVFDGWIDLGRDGGKRAAGQVYLVIRYEGDQVGATTEGGSSMAAAAAAVVAGGAVAAVVAHKLDEKERKKKKNKKKDKKWKKQKMEENGEEDSNGAEEGGSASDSSSDGECEGGDVGGDEESAGGVGKMIGNIFEAFFGDDD